MDVPSGAFAVSLLSLAWQPDGANAKAAERQVWAFVQLVLPPDQPLESVWFSAEDDNMATRSVSVSAQSGGQALPLDYIQSSRAVPLTTEALRELVQAQLLLSLHYGTSRARATDSLLGKTLVPLRTALLGQRKRQQVELTCPGEVFVLDLDVQCDVALADFLLGARVLELQSPSVVNLPVEWTFPNCMSNEEALQVCAAREQNTACYELDITLPQLGTKGSAGADAGGDDGAAPPYQFDVTTLKGGKLCFQPAVVDTGKGNATLEVAQLPSASEYQQEERLASPVSTLSGEWSVRFPGTTVISVLYFKTAVERLTEFLKVEKHGVYHSFKEALKKRTVPVIREIFARAEVEPQENEDDSQAQPDEKTVEEKKKEQFGQLYTLLMQEVNAVLHETFYSDSNALLEKAHATVEGRPSLKDIASVLEVLRLKTVENEVSGDLEKSEMLHLDRIAYAEQHAAHTQTRPKTQNSAAVDKATGSQLLMGVWFDYARFCIAQAKLEKAGVSFVTSRV
ncbi:Tetratricopeptide repeat-containing domain [Phytophthora cinnamomi]|uniref:Tetratricopeptide repeat-containing domain n=1 Tax=Phytophthora cinnamomi TaxID=4785 RepID=UPI00355A4E8E|nr:Tetratricopeptide repeat-containing domain [Phytophthora cinnamomi]